MEEKFMETKSSLQEKLLIRLEELPEPHLQEVLNFVDFLLFKEKNGEDPVLKVAGCLSGRPLSVEEIERELYGENQRYGG